MFTLTAYFAQKSLLKRNWFKLWTVSLLWYWTKEETKEIVFYKGLEWEVFHTVGK